MYSYLRITRKDRKDHFTIHLQNEDDVGGIESQDVDVGVASPKSDYLNGSIDLTEEAYQIKHFYTSTVYLFQYLRTGCGRFSEQPG